MQRRREIGAHGFDLLASEGPSHSPRFVVVGWAEERGRRIETEPCSGSTKKEARIEAAQRLLEMLWGGVEEGDSGAKNDP